MKFFWQFLSPYCNLGGYHLDTPLNNGNCVATVLAYKRVCMHFTLLWFHFACELLINFHNACVPLVSGIHKELKICKVLICNEAKVLPRKVINISESNVLVFQKTLKKIQTVLQKLLKNLAKIVGKLFEAVVHYVSALSLL